MQGQFCVHLDAFFWVKRDSYLPQGSQGANVREGWGMGMGTGRAGRGRLGLHVLWGT
jgi:hypothetical protein